jgi:hypothetical protein
VADTAGRDPVNVLGELIEDSALCHGGTIGTVASAHVAEEVIERLRSDPALAAAILDGPVDSEWGIQDEAGDIVMPAPGGRYTEGAARRNLLPGDVLVRRRPAGPWEPAPDTPATRKPANPPRGPSGASPSADGTAR